MKRLLGRRLTAPTVRHRTGVQTFAFLAVSGLLVAGVPHQAGTGPPATHSPSCAGIARHVAFGHGERVGRLSAHSIPEDPTMASARMTAGLLAFSLLGCTPPSGLSSTDGLDAPGSTALPSTLFPNAPAESGWKVMADLVWTQKIPFRGTYDPDNGTHLINWGDDDPKADWGDQLAIVDDAQAPGPVRTVLEVRLPRGLTGGYGTTKLGQHPDWQGDGPFLWNPALSTGFLYTGVYLRFSPGYSLNGNIGQKVLYAKSDLPENSMIAHMILATMNDDAGGSQLWPAYTPQNPFARYPVPTVGAFNLNDGRWHLVELLQTPNTPGLENGTLRFWVDGQLAASWSNAVFFAPGQTPSLNRIELSSIFGGGTHPVPANQWMRVGPLRIATR